MEQALPSPLHGRHRSRRCQLALDLTVRGTGYHHPPRETATWLVLFRFSFQVCCFFGKNFSSEFATLHSVLADTRATARTTTCRVQTKKKLWMAFRRTKRKSLHMVRSQQCSGFFLSSCRARSRLRRSSKRIVLVDYSHVLENRWKPAVLGSHAPYQTVVGMRYSSYAPRLEFPGEQEMFTDMYAQVRTSHISAIHP